MKRKSQPAVEDKPLEELNNEDSSSPPSDGDSISTKKAALEQKCGDLLESLSEFPSLHQSILAALAESQQQTLTSLQAELIQLKAVIPNLEKKSIKRLKLAGTLTSLEKQSQKIKLKANQRRRKDLSKLEDFVLDALRSLRALNQKISER